MNAFFSGKDNPPRETSAASSHDPKKAPWNSHVNVNRPKNNCLLLPGAWNRADCVGKFAGVADRRQQVYAHEEWAPHSAHIFRRHVQCAQFVGHQMYPVSCIICMSLIWAAVCPPNTQPTASNPNAKHCCNAVSQFLNERNNSPSNLFRARKLRAYTVLYLQLR